MAYEPLYHALQIWQLYTFAQKQKQAENRLFLQIKSERILDIFLGVFNKTIIPLTPVGYEMIIANLALHASLAIHHLSNKHSWNNC